MSAQPAEPERKIHIQRIGDSILCKLPRGEELYFSPVSTARTFAEKLLELIDSGEDTLDRPPPCGCVGGPHGGTTCEACR